MCYKGKCLYCIPIKPACLVLAIINAVVHGLILMGYVFVWGFVLLVIETGGISFNRDVWFGLSLIWYCLVAPMVLLLNVIFSALLCNGIHNSRPKQVKAYFWYGLVVTVLVVIASVVLMYIDIDNPYAFYLDESGTTELICLLVCVLHALFLVLVHQTHKKVVEDTISNGPARLNEERELSDKKHLMKV